MSESEEENFCFFGKPLEQYDEDSIPKRRPISVEDQIATDAQGRRRFHGAFTGGFSAGHFNTVGTPEGWTPSEFKSSRQEKSHNVSQKPEDFMDDEDLGEHGIAPQVVRATKDYSTSKKRKKQTFSDGPIPGIPVLHSLLTTGNETVGYLLLKNIGIKDKVAKQMDEVGSAEVGKIYGCQMPKTYEISKSIENTQYIIPEIYVQSLSKPKHNSFGLGYEGLAAHINLFKTPDNFVVNDKNKKLSIKGQAFGVGAFEDEDEDIYVKEDMSNYDFELTAEKQAKKNKSNHNLKFDMFIHSKVPLLAKKSYPPPTIPHSFSGKHKVKKSRFEPLPEEKEEVARSQINPNIRAKYLGENSEKEYTMSKSSQNLKRSNQEPKREEKVVEVKSEPKECPLASVLLLDKFVSATKKDSLDIMANVEKYESVHGTQEMRDAVKMKMFGALTRVTSDFYPNALLCKRFNVPEPFADRPEKERKRTKNLIFQPPIQEEIQQDLKPGLSEQKNNSTDTDSIIVNAEVTNTDETENNKTEVQPSSIEQEIPQPERSTAPKEADTIKEEIEEINMPKDITEKVDVEKNTDLFKAIFLDSSESESEDEEKINEEKKDKEEELKTSVLSDSFIPKIKPIREGILSGVNLHTFSKPNKPIEGEDNKEEVEVEQSPSTRQSEDKDSLLYGPKIPAKVINNKNESSIKIVVSSNSEDEWVEKGNEKKKKKHKKEKKHKKDKHKSHKHDKKKKHKDRN